MSDIPTICTTLYQCVYAFQTLISGIVAVLAAAGTAFVIWRSARLPFDEQKRRETELVQRQIIFAGSVLSQQLLTIATRARQAEGTIKAVIASNTNVNDDTRRKTILEMHPMIDNWEVMSVFPSNLLQGLAKFRHEISDHNFDMMRAGGVFGDNNFRQSILARICRIEQAARTLSGLFMALIQRTNSAPQNFATKLTKNFVTRKIHVLLNRRP